VAARGVERRNTWYLASDQFAFLTFAGDLAQGRVLHDPSTLELLVPRPNPRRTYDAFAQTYFWTGDKLFSRYPPGFPALLAAAGLIGGETAQHWLNPALYLTTLAVLALLVWVLLRPHDRPVAAGAAATATWLALLLPTDLHLWGITLARDLPAHLLGLLALLAGVARRHVLCGLALGLACTVRPDAVLYGSGLAALFWLDGVRVRALLLGGCAFVLGVLPLLAYNVHTGGHPFAFTQAGEFRELWSLVGPAVAHAQPIVFDSGGAFRLANLQTTLPQLLKLLAGAFGAAGVLLVPGIAWAVRRRRAMAAVLLPYPLVALPFYGCWSHADPRYLAGVALCLVPFAALGAALAGRWLAHPDRTPATHVVVVATATAIVLLGWRGVLPLEPLALALVAGLGLVSLLALPVKIGAELRSFAPLAPALALFALAVAKMQTGSGARDPFQATEVARARQTLGSVLPRDAVVLTSERLGRPAENVAHYVGVPALYLGELPLLRTDHRKAAILLAMGGRRPFFLLDEERAAALTDLRAIGGLRIVGRRRGDEVLDWFVDPRRGGHGVVLYEFVLDARQRRLLGEFRAHVEGER
jgi:hypothetical protein